MSARQLPPDAYPPAYTNKTQGLGRIVEGILAPETGSPNGGTGFLYEAYYANFRKAMEELRNASPSSFYAYTDSIINKKALSPEAELKVSELMKKNGVNLSPDAIRFILNDWKKNGQGFSPSYQPAFKVAVGTPTLPVDRSHYEHVALKVEEIRALTPEFSKDLDRLLKSSNPENLMYAESWHKANIPGSDEKTARAFARAVSGLSGLDIPAASTYTTLSPALFSTPE